MPRSFKPTFEGPIEGYVVNSMRTNYFRVEATMTREDYMQEAHLVFLQVRKHYQGKVSEPKHFMALFKRAWSNRLADLSTIDTRERELFCADHSSYDGEPERQYEAAGDLDNDGQLVTLIRQAPREVALVLNLFLSAPQEMLELALQSWRGRDKRCKAGGSERICRLLGLDPSHDVMQQVEEYLTAN